MPKKSFFAKITGIKRNKDKDTQEETPLKEEDSVTIETPDEIPESTDTSVEEKSAPPSKVPQPTDQEGDWVQENYEGQLSVDVYQTESEIVIKSAVAGVAPKDLDVSITNDMVTVRGTRELGEEVKSEDYFYQECYWGSFSRSIIVPHEVDSGSAKADFSKGILTIRLPKTTNAQEVKIQITEDED